MKEVCECYVNCADNDGDLLYGCFYHVVGLCQMERVLDRNWGNICRWDSKVTFSISSDFWISFQEYAVLLEKDFPLPAIRIEFLA